MKDIDFVTAVEVRITRPYKFTKVRDQKRKVAMGFPRPHVPKSEHNIAAFKKFNLKLEQEGMKKTEF